MLPVSRHLLCLVPFKPLYLFGGAQPPKELLHKFFLAKPCKVNVISKGMNCRSIRYPWKLFLYLDTALSKSV